MTSIQAGLNNRTTSHLEISLQITENHYKNQKLLHFFD